MNNPTAIEMQTYLDKHYYTLAQLAQKSGVEEAFILKLIKNQCVPPHSYSMQTFTAFTNSLIQYSASPTSVYYYHPSLLGWIHKARGLFKLYDLTKTAQLIRENFIEEYNETFGNTATPGCKNADEAWSYLMDGTWGICLKEISISCMAKKQLSRLTIANIVKTEAEHALSLEERLELKNAIETYKSAAMDFDPYFAPISSRYREVIAAELKYKI
ncbi:MAG: hypothetical protein K0R66_323 [Gammaproteobacteria bacterium]|jgi:hypothetical protein|nr:hypothetical protein [Gammaproteobacteria bacterium]